MLEVLQMFLFLFKSKYRRKCDFVVLVFLIFVVLNVCTLVAPKCLDADCNGNGVCKNDTCVCYDGWQGPQCQFCGGKVRLGTPAGVIHDGLGNYSLSVKCSWLIDALNSSITLHLEEFATECGWDHLYIFDGDSVNSPLLAVFSGLMYKENYSIRRIPEVVANSGSALVHFFSDDAYNMSGFKMTYRLNACPSKLSGLNCSGHGECLEDGSCTCDGGWTGLACHLEKCPNKCGSNKGMGECAPEVGCICYEGFKGNDCNQKAHDGFWETSTVQGFTPNGSASHGAVVWRDSMYVVAGESYNYNRGAMLYVYDFNGNVWETPQISASPAPRYSHSTVIYGDKIFLYGGVIGSMGSTSELWAFDIRAKTWENITVKADACNSSYLMCGPLKTAGHSATVVINTIDKKADKMIVIFGHSPHLGYLNTVQEYSFGTREWHIVNTSGFSVKGGYGHTASWDPLTAKIYVYGGVISESESAQVLTRNLYSYDPNNRVWMSLTNAPSARFLHTATFIHGGLMLVFGGNTHNDTARSSGAKCFSSDFLSYDVTCDSWHKVPVPKVIHSDLARFGHSAVVFEGSQYIYGGFDGQMLSDILKYTPGNCTHFTNKKGCLKSTIGMKCFWDRKNKSCLPIQGIPKNYSLSGDAGDNILCPAVKSSVIIQNIKKCNSLDDCVNCFQTSTECIWCGNCTHKNSPCRNNSEPVLMNVAQCKRDQSPLCKQLHTCTACTLQPYCKWEFEHKRCEPHSNVTAETDEPIQCQKVCADYNSCVDCTQGECIWCQNEGRCVDKNAYTSSFPYGQCREWITDGQKCRTRGAEENCGYYKTCAQCRNDPACGWCDKGTKTGLGVCLPGGYGGPTLHTQSLSYSTCPPERWHFTTCPSCQCNGHANCFGNTSQCLPCKDNTTGSNCERCIKGFWGDPINGGYCTPCECNGQAKECHPETGKCFCTTKGLHGDVCEICDTTNHYQSDHLNGGCFYELTTDYLYIFNLSKKEDTQYTQINLRNSPISADTDVYFSITCPVYAKMNITIRRGNSKDEKHLYSGDICGTFCTRFAKSEYNVGNEDNVTLATFFVYVYDFHPPLWIRISFYNKFKLGQLFGLF